MEELDRKAVSCPEGDKELMQEVSVIRDMFLPSEGSSEDMHEVVAALICHIADMRVRGRRFVTLLRAFQYALAAKDVKLLTKQREFMAMVIQALDTMSNAKTIWVLPQSANGNSNPNDKC